MYHHKYTRYETFTHHLFIHDFGSYPLVEMSDFMMTWSSTDSI